MRLFARPTFPFEHHCDWPRGKKGEWGCPACHRVWTIKGSTASSTNESEGVVSAVTMRYPDGTEATFIDPAAAKLNVTAHQETP